MLKTGAIFIGLLSALVVLLEKTLPVQDSLRFEELPDSIKEWKQKGKYLNVFGRNMFYIQEGDMSRNSEAVVFFHGFPTSSYDYAKALRHLKQVFPNRQLLFFDHVGFGFSDKPNENYEYTLHDHAENALDLLRQLNIQSAHIVSHDMGDSILTEVLLRRHLKLLPDYFDNFFKSVTFTNGGMHYDSANLRLSQMLLNNHYLGRFFSSLYSRLPTSISSVITERQLESIYSPNSDPKDRDEDIEAITALTRLNGGMTLTHKTVSYLKDRARFESRWYR